MEHTASIFYKKRMFIRFFCVYLQTHHSIITYMLRIIRIILALTCFLAITMLFLDFSGTAATNWGWLARFQIIPALMSVNLVAIIALSVITLLFGRVYCSVLCPLGVLQDIVSRLRIWLAGKRKRRIGVFKYHPVNKNVRYIFFGIFIVLLILGLINLLASSIAALIEPYSAYGRIATGVFKPLYVDANNYLADIDAQNGQFNYFYINNVISPAITAIGGITLIVVGVTAALTGRGYCNTVCPVGTMLGWISKHSLFRITIDTNKCTKCGACARHCKSSCIDAKNHAIDYSRCVDCMDCLSHCQQGALSFKPLFGKQDKVIVAEAYNVDSSRRNFLTIAGIATGAIVAGAADKLTDGGLTPLKTRKIPTRDTRITPPGSVSHSHLSQHCIGCQLCIQACPSGVLKTSSEADSFMQPFMQFTSESYCPASCTVCSNICPAGAFNPLDETLKSSTKIGTALVDYNTCLAATDTDSCGNCQRHCPVGAITMIPVNKDSENGALMPMVNENICIGCGACEAHCPVGTVSTMAAEYPAIHVNGISVHQTI